MAREYELMFILKPDLTEEEKDKIVTQATEWVTSSGGEVTEVDKVGTRKLAYRIEGHREGFYVLIRLKAVGDTVKEVERRLKVSDSVIKFISVRVDEELKKLEKMKKKRAEREARRKARPRPAEQVTPASTEGEARRKASARPAEQVTPASTEAS